MRSFVAVPVSGPAGSMLVDSLGDLDRRQGVRLVPIQNIHVTLAFLGQIQERQVPAAADAMTAATRDIKSFALQIGPGHLALGGRRTLAAAVGGNVGPLHQICERLRSHLERAGLPFDDRPLRPHATLARLQRSLPAEQRLAAGLHFEQIMGKVKVTSQVNCLALYSSRLEAGGAVYQVLQRAKLPGSCDPGCAVRAHG